MKLHLRADPVFSTAGPRSHFFGYYDKSPIDSSGNRLLAHRTDFDGRDITADDRAEVGYFDLETGSFITLGETRAFNWQQGAMLQWLPPDFSRRVIYNDRRKGRFVSVIVDAENGTEQKVLPFPVYSVHPSGEFALTVNYERLYFCRPGYNYQGIVNTEWDRPVHDRDGIWRLDLTNGETERVVSTRRVFDFDHLSEMEGRDNWLEHMMWNPSGTRFAFFHRWDDGAGGHSTRLLTVSPDGSDLYLFPHTGFYSHMAWCTDQEFLIWGRQPSALMNSYLAARRFRCSRLVSLVRPLVRWCRDHLAGQSLRRATGGQGYLRMKDRSPEAQELAPDLLRRNGHMSFSPVNPGIMLSDTYEDSEGFQHLFLFDLDKGRKLEIGRFFAPVKRETYRCDLHPRWDRAGTRVVIDSAHADRKTRQMYLVDISNLVCDLQ